MEKQFLYQDKNIFYRVVGKGKPVMLVHGFGEHSAVWDNQVNHLQNKYCVITPDLPGSGQSALIDDMSMEGMAEVLKAIVEKEIADMAATNGKITLIGHSMGGYITLAFAEKYGSILDAFGLFHSSAFADGEEKKEVRRKGIEFIKENGAFAFLKTATPKLFSPLTAEKNPALVEQQIEACRDFTQQALVAYYEAMIKRPDRTGILRNAVVPVLFVIGKFDTAIPMEDMLKQSLLPKISHIHVLHESGHMGMLEEPKKANDVLLQFLG